MRKSIYVKDEDVELFEWAETLETSLSSVIAYALTKLREQGAEEIDAIKYSPTSKEMLQQHTKLLTEIADYLQAIKNNMLFGK